MGTVAWASSAVAEQRLIVGFYETAPLIFTDSDSYMAPDAVSSLVKCLNENKDAQMVLEALKNRADANARDGAGTGALKYAMAFGDGSIN